MKKLVMVVTVCLLLLSGISAYSLEGDVKQTAEKETTTVENTLTLIYMPPFGTIGKPIRRVSGGTRGLNKGFDMKSRETQGPDNKDLLLAALAPEHTGLTLSKQPVLCWFQSGEAKAKVTLAGIKVKNTNAVFDHIFDRPLKKGIRCLNLAAYNGCSPYKKQVMFKNKQLQVF